MHMRCLAEDKSVEVPVLDAFCVKVLEGGLITREVLSRSSDYRNCFEEFNESCKYRALDAVWETSDIYGPSNHL